MLSMVNVTVLVHRLIGVVGMVNLSYTVMHAWTSLPHLTLLLYVWKKMVPPARNRKIVSSPTVAGPRDVMSHLVQLHSISGIH